MSEKTITMYRVEASYSDDVLIVEYPSLAGTMLDEATHGKFEDELVHAGDWLTFKVTRVLMSPDEIEELNDAPVLEGFR